MAAIDAPTRTASGLNRPVAVVVLFGLGLAGGAVALGDRLDLHGDLHVALTPTWWWVMLAIAATFAAAELLVFHIEFRREALTHTLTEVPAALALVFLGLDQAIAARVLATVVVLGLMLRLSWFKVVFNAGMYSFTMWLGFFVMRALLGEQYRAGESLVLVLVVTLFLVALVEATLVLLAIAVFEGDFLLRLRAEVRSGAVRYPTAAVIGALTAAVAAEWPSMALLFTVPIIAVWGLMRVHGRTSQRLRDLEQLHQISSSVTRSLHRSDIASVAVSEVSRLLRADRVMLRLFASTGVAEVTTSSGSVFSGCPSAADDPEWRDLLEGPARLVDTALVTAGGGSMAGRTVIAAPVRDDEGVVGLLLIGERGGAEAEFDDGDAVRAMAIADRLGLALRNATLHEQIEHEAWHDQLTGLPNRTLFERSLDERLADGSGSRLVVMAIGLDRFRDINSTLGHSVGDDVLGEFAQRLITSTPEDPVVARLSGDEFAVACRAGSEADALRTARSLQAVLHAPFEVAGLAVSVNTSVGTVLSEGAATDAALLLRRADMAMHWAKSNHTNVEIFRDDIDSSAPERLSMLTELRSALELRQLEVYFQPKVDLGSGTVVGAEALVRWNHPTRGVTAPVEFVQLAENTGLISELTDQVLQQTVAAVRLLHDLGFDLAMSVNLSTIDLLDDTIVARVERVLADALVDPAWLTLEITETALLSDGARTLATADALHRLGAQLSIDDFGTGFSSLSYLRTLPTSELKIDRSFVGALMIDERDEVIVRSTIDLGHNLGLRVVAEGVEDLGTFERLRTLGCDAAQGFVISRPLPFDRFLVWLNSCSYPVARSGRSANRIGTPSSLEEQSPGAVVLPIRSA